MTKVAAVRFRTAGKTYYFDPEGFELKRGMHVIVETAQGIEYAQVTAPPFEVEDEKVTKPLKKITRIATKEDDDQNEENLLREKEAFHIGKQKIADHGLEMKLIDCEYSFDRSRLTFYFTADGRVDFRELVKDLAGTFRLRIELRQIGVRDATRMLGGLGSCGRELCCHAYMRDFVPVSIKMAKEQNLSLNPGKISGMCGRLMCCLSYEAEAYAYLNRHMPKMGEKVKLPDGREGTVQSMDILKGRVKVMTFDGDERELEEYSASDLEFKKRGKEADKPTEEESDELKLIEALEEKDMPVEEPVRKRENKNHHEGKKERKPSYGNEKHSKEHNGDFKKKKKFHDKKHDRDRHGGKPDEGN